MTTIILYLCASLTPQEINAEIYEYHRLNREARVIAVVSECSEK